ncbi:MAG: hypothetical protein ACK4M9_13510 [Anaerobacillus sp.]|uniref:hypothetical protein n=1 Tax=Anaerobacillus sp. TaxID=1872506 RepID=UPI0039190ECD
MEDNKQQESYRGRNYFDSLMFGPAPRQMPTMEQKQTNQVAPPEPVQSDVKQTQQEQPIHSQDQQSNAQPQVDLAQMMQQFDMLMEYANKLGPSFKKLGPLFDLIKGFNGKK